MSKEIATAEQLQESSPRGGASSPVYNPTTGHGITGIDATVNTRIRRNLNLDREILETSYAESDLVRKIVSIYIDDALIKGINLLLEEDERVLVEERMEELDVLTALRESDIASKVYGDGYLVIDDGMSPLFDFDIETYQAGSLTQLVQYNGYDLIPDPDSVGNVFGSGLVGEPTIYMLRDGDRSNNYLPIPYSRVIRFSHVLPPKRGWNDSETSGIRMKKRNYCSLGLLQALLHYITAELEGVSGSRRLIEQSSMLALAVDEFSNNEYGSVDQQLAQYTSLVRMLSLHGLLIHEKGSDPQRIKVDFGGLNEMLQRNIDRIAVALDSPISRFSGTEATGLNASGEASTKRWSAKIAQFQRERLDPVLSIIFQIIAKDLSLEAINWSWKPWLPTTAKEEAEEQGLRIDNAIKLQELLQNVELDEDAKTAMLNRALQGVFDQ